MSPAKTHVPLIIVVFIINPILAQTLSEPEVCNVFENQGNHDGPDLCERPETRYTQFSLHNTYDYFWETAINPVSSIHHSILLDITEYTDLLEENQNIRLIEVSSDPAAPSFPDPEYTIYSLNITKSPELQPTMNCLWINDCTLPLRYKLFIQRGGINESITDQATFLTLDDSTPYKVVIHWQQNSSMNNTNPDLPGFVDITAINLNTLRTERIRSYDHSGSTSLAKTYYYGNINTNFDSSDLNGTININDLINETGPRLSR